MTTTPITPTAAALFAPLRRAPWRLVFSGAPWAALVSVAASAIVGVAILGGLRGWALLVLPLLALPIAAFERRRVRLLRVAAIPSGHAPIGDDAVAWFRNLLREPLTLREVGYSLVFGFWSIACALVGGAWIGLLVVTGGPLLEAALYTAEWPSLMAQGYLPQGIAFAIGFVALVVAAPYAVYALAAAQVLVAVSLLTPREEQLKQEVASLTSSRRDLVEAFSAEQRRIERDLHDGVQQRVVALGITLGTARLELDHLADRAGDGDDVEAVRGHLERAQREVEATSALLRTTVRGIHPQVLSDRGLAPAIAELAGRSGIPVTVVAVVDERMPAAVESAAYFTVSEALTNATKHSGATVVQVTAALDAEALDLEIRDDGAGGATVGEGSGLAGLRARAEIIGGTLTVVSPAGAFTSVRLRVPRTEFAESRTAADVERDATLAAAAASSASATADGDEAAGPGETVDLDDLLEPTGTTEQTDTADLNQQTHTAELHDVAHGIDLDEGDAITATPGGEPSGFDAEDRARTVPLDADRQGSV